MAQTIRWPDLAAYGLTLQLATDVDGRRTLIATADDEHATRAFGPALIELGFGVDGRSMCWSREADLGVRALAAAFPLMTMREKPDSEVFVTPDSVVAGDETDAAGDTDTDEVTLEGGPDEAFYAAMVTPEVIQHMRDSVLAARYEGNDHVRIDADRIVANFADTLTPAQYKAFDQELAEEVLFRKLDEVEKELHLAESGADAGSVADDSATSPRRRRRAAGERIEDFGEHIGGAKKERWSRARGIRLENVEGWTAEERAALLTKDRVWPMPDWKARLEAGADLGVLHRIKEIRDLVHAFPGEPASGYRSGSRRQTRWLSPAPGKESAYLAAVGRLADRLSDVQTPADAEAAFADYVAIETTEKPGNYTRKRYTWTEQGEALRSHCDERRAHYRYTEFFEPRGFERDAAVASDSQWPFAVRKIQRGAIASREIPRKPLDHIQRVGGIESLGRDVLPQDFLDTFGFRGGEFGNWVSQAERQASLNHGYHALLDLAAVLNLPPRGLSLGGTLAIAFGARGSGRYAAHYEPGRRVINLTKPSGAGALAHEWAHALDHWLATETGTATDYRRPYASPFGADVGRVRQPPAGAEVIAAVDAFTSAMVRRPMTVEEFDRKQVDRWESALRRADGWAEWLVRDAMYALSAAAQRADMTSAEHAQLSAEVRNSAPIRNLRDLVDGMKSDRTWTAVPGAARALAESLESAFVNAVGRRRSGKNRGHAITAVRRVGAYPAPSANTTGERPLIDTAYFTDSKKWDGGRKANPYYATPWEMFARALETCVNDALEDRGWQNDYLVHSTRYAMWVESPKGSPYPHGDELAQLRQHFDMLSTKLGEFLQSRELRAAPDDAVDEQPAPRAASMNL